MWKNRLLSRLFFQQLAVTQRRGPVGKCLANKGLVTLWIKTCRWGRVNVQQLCSDMHPGRNKFRRWRHQYGSRVPWRHTLDNKIVLNVVVYLIFGLVLFARVYYENIWLFWDFPFIQLPQFLLNRVIRKFRRGHCALCPGARSVIFSYSTAQMK